jgi:tRNA nucleotidyltransferase (CCA-adding enzyme)
LSARWWHFEHEADMGVAGEGDTLASAFEQTAHALMNVVTEEPVERRERVEIHCDAPSAELLLVDWLNALVYEMATRRVLFGEFDVTTDGRHLDAVAWGERVDRARHQPAVEVKGATYTALSVTRTNDGGFRAQCVVDV